MDNVSPMSGNSISMSMVDVAVSSVVLGDHLPYAINVVSYVDINHTISSEHNGTVRDTIWMEGG